MAKENRFLQKFESLFKCKLIPMWRLERFAQSAYLRGLLETRSVDCVLDVGANTGQYRDYLREQIGFSGWIISFEPNPVCLMKMKDRVSNDPKWVVTGCALGAAPGSLQFNVTKNSEFSSFLSPDASRFFNNENAVSKVIPVEVKVLQDVYPDLASRLGFTRPFLKLDTQGFDLEVVKGAVDILPRLCGIQTEVSNVPIYQEIPNMPDTLEFFDKMGFELGMMFPANPSQFPIVVDFDTYFLPKVEVRPHFLSS